MPDPILLLRLEAPMQSWGTRSRWDVRDSGLEPTKSGVLGMLGCAAGLPRRHERLETLDTALRLGVRCDRPGTIATDYHTVTGPHRMANGKQKAEGYTVQSYRDYLHDAAFLAALTGPLDLLEELIEWLRSPRWPFYLGRKSCVPTRPVLDSLTRDYTDIEDAVKRAPWSAPVNGRTQRAIIRSFCPETVPVALKDWVKDEAWKAEGTPYELTAWVEDPERGDYERQDALRTNALRFYEFRRVRRVSVPLDKLEVLG